MTATVCLLIVAATSAIADVDIPEEWIGVWELDSATYDCETDELLFSSTNLDTICAGSVFPDPEPGEITIECTGSADATSYTGQCEGSFEVIPGCTVNFLYESTATRNGDTYTSTSTITISYVGDCPVIPDTCQRTEATGTRIESPTDPCSATPVESVSWGTVKTLYR